MIVLGFCDNERVNPFAFFAPTLTTNSAAIPLTLKKNLDLRMGKFFDKLKNYQT
ncbi:hypothetical protein HYPBUDRAFT_153945 [Hyphopichia burtonii NRRL Y-1933]|uniref:Uncharacterized protein n=1 Tax=Hyphopichia burtonii NRRL Y-1933 TaxID=984485 RepID=A0A1E4RCR4_9ASCO|nr:hypothetical protein HYPBUDRAFT_153945 [Hyphopichia burtonii NRRL Y-1933]ODV65040.1 hypothetical protein HYPBUDRAFT_153945 [Hyphopichia burtonii NRRL Y-1933]